ncbi:MAG: endo alpha-1,4 polygalactosaminidase [Candidatus Rokuibacteriota bacterium]
MGLTQRLLAAALALGLGGTPTPAYTASPGPPARPLAGVRTWAVYYGSAPDAAGPLARFDVVVLEPNGHPPLAAVKRHGSLVLMYVSLGEVNTHHPEFARIAGEPWVLAANPSWPDARLLDVRAPGYERWLLERVVPPALAGPVNGLFLDTADSALELERVDPKRYAGMARALERVLTELKRRHPRALLLLNSGLPLAERLPRVVDGVAMESVWTDYDFKARAYRARPAEDAESRAELLARITALGLPVFTLEYTGDEGNPDWPAELIRRSRGRGFVPYVSTIGLDRVHTHTLGP